MKIEMEETPIDNEIKKLHISSLDEDDENEDSNDPIQDDEEDTEEEEEEEEQVAMTLGFPEKPKNIWSLFPQYFPSKAGGTPAWLDPVNLPSEKTSCCGFCGEPMQFLLQVYAPLSEESTFHRTLYVFMCKSMACLLRDQHEQWKRQSGMQCRSVKVLRCQLPRVNSFYSSESPAADGSAQPLVPGALLCNWCGTWKGDKICNGCKRTRYCSAKHQAAHWKSTNASHRHYCRQLEVRGETSVSAASNSLWPEYEIINEDECELADSETPNNNESGNSLIPRNHVDDSIAELQTYFEGREDTRSFATFQDKISLAPDQILRYSTSAHAKPLWPMYSGRPSKPDIPKCNYCGGSRSFEFQVLPQLLYFFHVKDTEDSLDWSTIVVYTCEASCGGGMGYKEEFAFIQLPSQQRRAPGIVS